MHSTFRRLYYTLLASACALKPPTRRSATRRKATSTRRSLLLRCLRKRLGWGRNEGKAHQIFQMGFQKKCPFTTWRSALNGQSVISAEDICPGPNLTLRLYQYLPLVVSSLSPYSSVSWSLSSVSPCFWLLLPKFCRSMAPVRRILIHSVLRLA